MNTRLAISRGVEKIVAQRHALLRGLGSLGPLDDISKLEQVATGRTLKGLRRLTDCTCKQLVRALPVANAVKDILTTANGSSARPNFEQVETLQGLSGKLTVAKAEKKIAAINKKEAKHDAAIQKKLAKYAGNAKKLAAVQKKETKHDAAIQKKLTKYGSVISAAAAAALAAQNKTPLVATPTDTAAAALLAQAGVPSTPATSALATDVMSSGGGGGGGAQFAPTETPATEEAPAGSGFFDSIPPWALAVGAVGVGVLLMRRRK